jgi:hypothetical protein
MTPAAVIAAALFASIALAALVVLGRKVRH